MTDLNGEGVRKEPMNPQQWYDLYQKAEARRNASTTLSYFMVTPEGSTGNRFNFIFISFVLSVLKGMS